MRVFYARPPKGAHGFIVDSRGRARLARAGIVTPKAAALAAGCALLAIAPQYGPGERLVASAQAAMQSAADYIRARSPGQRRHAHLVKTKHPRAAPKRAAHAAPRHRAPAPPPAALALITPPPPALPLSFADAALVPAYPPVFAGYVPVLPETPRVPCCFAGFNPPIGTGIGGIIGGGGGGPGPPPPGVPEPSRWALMILGFGLIGSAWRRRRVLLQAVRALPRLMHQRMLLLAYARA